jgi:hypothetical protein
MTSGIYPLSDRKFVAEPLQHQKALRQPTQRIHVLSSSNCLPMTINKIRAL